MNRPLLIKGGLLIDPRNHVHGRRDLLLSEGKVAAVSEQPLSHREALVIDANGLWVLPGLIDLHVHFREPGEEGKETLDSGSRAAVAGGFTAVVTMPNTSTVNDSAVVTHFIRARAKEIGLCRIYPAGAISKGLKGEELAEIGELAKAGCVCVTDDGRSVMNAGLMRRALQYTQAFGLPVMGHEEDVSLSGKGTMNEGVRATRLGLLPIPPSAEVTMVARDLILAEETQGRLHLAHLSCAGSVRLLREAKRLGVQVTAEATPHHFTLTDAAVEGYDTHAKMSPPLRQEGDVKAIQEALADGTLDAIATDHAPHDVLHKQVEFEKAANGIIGLETALPLTLELVWKGVLKPERAVALLSHGPAQAFNLPGGHLAVGAIGDVALVDPEERWTVDASTFFSKSRNTPFQGRSVKGRVTHTVVGGRVVFERGQIKESPPR